MKKNNLWWTIIFRWKNYMKKVIYVEQLFFDGRIIRKKVIYGEQLFFDGTIIRKK